MHAIVGCRIWKWKKERGASLSSSTGGPAHGQSNMDEDAQSSDYSGMSKRCGKNQRLDFWIETEWTKSRIA